ncbi:MAG: hypothetical protein K5778_10490 [Bacteroidaceae bacterium]|nr:hypothetical protein [Bacteroidaceae bacterium]
MTQDFFDTIRYDYSIDKILKERTASRVKLAFRLAKVQQNILEELGYKNLAPLSVDYDEIWFYIKDDKFHTVDDDNGTYRCDDNGTYRCYSHLYGDILLCLNDDGYHLCEPSSDNETKYYNVNNGVYYFLWDNDEYLELKYITRMRTWYCKEEFEYIKKDNYVAIKYHNKEKYGDSFMNEAERLIEKPRKDTIISREKDICHLEVFTYYYNDRIVVDDGNKVIVYDEEFNVLYESYRDFEIWEVNSTSYLLFPSEALVYDLSKGEEIELVNSDNLCWHYVKTYKNIAVFYTIERFQVEDNSYYDEDGDYWESVYNKQDIPIRNTTGHIFDSSFQLLREFNVIGAIEQLKEIGDTIVMIVHSSSTDYYNVNAPNLTRHIDKTDEDFSVPDITFRYMDRCMYDFEDENRLVIVTARVPSSDYIDLTESTKSQVFKKKCGVYYCVDKGIYKKIIECKYDYIKSLPIKDDYNVYYAGVIGLGEDNKYDFYINHKIVLQGIPFNRGHSVKLIKDGTFIQITNIDGKKGIIRNGNFIINPSYKEIRTFVQHERDYNPETNVTSETLKYLFAVSNGELFGICSPSGKLILPMKYSTIDMDDELCIVLVREFNPELDDECDESVKDMLDYGKNIYETGHYDEENDVIVTEKACFKDGNVLLDDEGNYVWDGSFRYLKENDYSRWTDQELRDAADIAYEGHSRLELGLD